MPENAYSIDLTLSEKLKDREYRKAFFWAEASAEIADALVKLRKRRNLNQKEVAELVGTKQPAISRAEQADYQNWNLNTLRSIAEALDARLRVLIEPSEDVLAEYNEAPQPSVSVVAQSQAVLLDTRSIAASKGIARVIFSSQFSGATGIPPGDPMVIIETRQSPIASLAQPATTAVRARALSSPVNFQSQQTTFPMVHQTP
jgi:transcriptional regulator with XRE-family HTH domain